MKKIFLLTLLFFGVLQTQPTTGHAEALSSIRSSEVTRFEKLSYFPGVDQIRLTLAWTNMIGSLDQVLDFSYLGAKAEYFTTGNNITWGFRAFFGGSVQEKKPPRIPDQEPKNDSKIGLQIEPSFGLHWLKAYRKKVTYHTITELDRYRKVHYIPKIYQGHLLSFRPIFAYLNSSFAGGGHLVWTYLYLSFKDRTVDDIFSEKHEKGGGFLVNLISEVKAGYFYPYGVGGSWEGKVTFAALSVGVEVGGYYYREGVLQFGVELGLAF